MSDGGGAGSICGRRPIHRYREPPSDSVLTGWRLCRRRAARCDRRSLVVAGVTFVLALTWAVAGQAATYYVTPAGSDFNPGTSPDLPWRTMAHVNQAELRPGDEVLFAAGQVWSDPLAPRAAGTRKGRISFGTYGEGRAILAGGVFLRDARWLNFSGFAISGISQGILSGVLGKGSRGIVLRDLQIADVRIAINSANLGDRGWRIEDNVIARTRDSAIILNGSNFTVARNQIVDAGISQKIPFAKHGIYAKGPRITVEHNRIDGASDSGISTRFPDALIQWNQISRSALGVGYFQDAGVGGVSVLRHNTITEVTNGIFLSDSKVESFIVHGNAISAAKNGLQAKRLAGLRAFDNSVQASSPLLLGTKMLPRPPVGYTDDSVVSLSELEKIKLRGAGREDETRLATTMVCSASAVERCSISLLFERASKRIGRALAQLAPGQRHVIQVPLTGIEIAPSVKDRRTRTLKVIAITRDASGAVTRAHTTARVRL